MIRFPDLSHYTQGVDFHAMKAGGVPCFITKASQGASNTDPTYADFHARGRSVGLIVGAYTFINPGDEQGTVDHFLATAKLQSGDLQPIVDAEAAGLSRAQTVQAMRALEARKYHPILYCSISFFTDVLAAPDNWPVWVAAYRAHEPQLPSGVTRFAWQYSDHGVCPGVANPCDMNQFDGDIGALKAFCIP
jgi:GH25 family lysozyme M1 (1,4-beta-N-acetylmuramidase)